MDENESEKKRFSRRDFLAVSLAGTVAVILEACGFRQTPEVTPTPTKTPHVGPTGASTSLPAGTPVPPSATPVPTDTLTPTSRPRAEATATSAPVPTPFPPGPPTKLGLFVGYNHPALWAFVDTKNLSMVKTVEYDPNFVAEIKSRSPKTIVVSRYTNLGQIDWEKADPKALARDFVDKILPIASEPKRRKNIDAWESYNEPVVNSPNAMSRLAEFEAERTRLLAREGIRSCVGNFGTGSPDLKLWPQFFPALRAVKETNGFLGLHEYSAPYMWFGTGKHQLNPAADEGDEGWLTLRYRKVYRQYLIPAGLAVPLLITETGVDGTVQNRPGPKGKGWRDFADFWKKEGYVRFSAGGFYVEQLAWYDAELMQDDYVKGAAIYALAAPPGWESFEIIGECANILRQYISVHPRRK